MKTINDDQALFFKEHPRFNPRKTTFHINHMSYLTAYLDNQKPHENDICQRACSLVAHTEYGDYFYSFIYYPEGVKYRKHDGTVLRYWIADKHNPPLFIEV